MSRAVSAEKGTVNTGTAPVSGKGHAFFDADLKTVTSMPTSSSHMPKCSCHGSFSRLGAGRELRQSASKSDRKLMCLVVEGLGC